MASRGRGARAEQPADDRVEARREQRPGGAIGVVLEELEAAGALLDVRVEAADADLARRRALGVDQLGGGGIEAEQRAHRAVAAVDRDELLEQRHVGLDGRAVVVEPPAVDDERRDRQRIGDVLERGLVGDPAERRGLVELAGQRREQARAGAGVDHAASWPRTRRA
jgi:hypothetical protein